LKSDKYYLRHEFEKSIRKNIFFDSPRWMEIAVEQKNPQLTIALVNSISLVYNKLDEELLNLTRLN